MISTALDLGRVEDLMASSVGQVFPCGQLQIHWQDQVICSQAYGQLQVDHPCTPQHQFDIASITKLFTATAWLRLASQRDLDLEGSVQLLLPEIATPRPLGSYEDPLHPGQWITLSPQTDPMELIDPQQLTWRQLLTHSSGLPPWRPLFRCPNRQAAVEMALGTCFSYPPGTQVRYSDIGLIWIGLALERLTEMPLDQVIQSQVIEPLGLKDTGFRPVSDDPIPQPLHWDPVDSIAATEDCRWRGRRIRGEVHDENGARLGGVAGHAGLFSTAADLARFGQCFLSGGLPLLDLSTRDQMIQPHAEQGDHRRGLGFALRSAHPEASSFPLSAGAYGHTGFTGTSLWIDPHHSLVVACLTNSIYYGRDHSGILPFRVALHEAIVSALEIL